MGWLRVCKNIDVLRMEEETDEKGNGIAEIHGKTCSVEEDEILHGANKERLKLMKIRCREIFLIKL